MAYIDSSLMVFRGENHKLFYANIPDESGSFNTGYHTMIFKNGEVIWEIMGRKGRQVIIPASRYRTVSDPWHPYTVIIDIDNDSHILQGSVGQYSNEGFVVNDRGIMMPYEGIYSKGFRNLSVNGAVFYKPDSKKNIEGTTFGYKNSFYGLCNGRELIELKIDQRGMVESEEVIHEFPESYSAYNVKYKGFDYCLMYKSPAYYTFNFKTKELHRVNIPSNRRLQWLTDGKFAFIRSERLKDSTGEYYNVYYLSITSDLENIEKEIYVGQSREIREGVLYCRYPYAYMWTTTSDSDESFRVFCIIKIDIVNGNRQKIFPETIKVGDVTFYVKKSDEQEDRQIPFVRLWKGRRIFWDYNEYFDDGVIKDDLKGAYGTVSVQTTESEYYSTHFYAVYMDNLELKPSDHNQTVFICDF